MQSGLKFNNHIYSFIGTQCTDTSWGNKNIQFVFFDTTMAKKIRSKYLNLICPCRAKPGLYHTKSETKQLMIQLNSAQENANVKPFAALSNS